MGGRRRSALPADLRDQLAQEAARVMVEHGIHDFGLAKRKAAERLGVRAAGGGLPSNGEIQERLAERQRLFEPEDHEARITKLRRLATDVMEQIEEFRPRLVGAVLDGTATINSAVELHVFSDSPELVANALRTAGHRVYDSQRRYRFGRADTPRIPGFDLVSEGEDVQVMVFGERGSHHAPLSPVDGRPMRRASRAAVLTLLGVNAC
jgi:hypothetical protein